MPLNLNRTAMPEQDPKTRVSNFYEVALGYTEEQARTEASRCLGCRNPLCEGGCPVQVPIRDFIAEIKKGDFAKAYRIINETNSLPAVCGRVCPQEEQCEKECVLAKKDAPIAIGRLERYAADWAMAHGLSDDVKPPEPNGHKVAVVGAGPAGLTCAGDLARRGYEATVFEAFHKPGGVLVYGIPEFRLPKSLVEREIETLKKLGVRFELNTIVGRTVEIAEMFQQEGFEAVFVGSGAGLPQFLGIPGENLNGVYSANEYLTRINLMKAYRPDSLTPVKKAKRAVVVGGGNVAMDAARSALRMGAQTRIVYRRTMQELPARREEVHHAIEEGVQFDLLTNPKEILGDNGWVRGIRCVRMALGEPDESGRRRPVEQPGTEFEIETDLVIVAIGTRPNPMLTSVTKGLETTRWGGIIVDEDTMATRLPRVYAGGDAVTGAATVILAMGAGKKAAASIDRQIMGSGKADGE